VADQHEQSYKVEGALVHPEFRKCKFIHVRARKILCFLAIISSKCLGYWLQSSKVRENYRHIYKVN
jgi:hypothetical protein